MGQQYEVISYLDREKEWQRANEKSQAELQLAQSFTVANTLLTQGYLDTFHYATISPLTKREGVEGLRMIHLKKLVFDPNEESRDKLVSIYGALYNIQSAVAIIIQSSGSEVNLYLCARSDDNPYLAGSLLESAFKGNFPGSEFDALTQTEITSIMNSNCTKVKSLALVSLIPSERHKDADEFVQGLEKFLNGMQGKAYTAVFLATPVSKSSLEQKKHGYEELYSALSSHAKLSVSYAQSQTLSVAKGVSSSFSKSVNKSVSNSYGESESSSSGTNVGNSSGSSVSFDGWGWNSGSSNGSFDSFTSGTTFSRAVSESTSTTEGDTDTITGTVSKASTDTQTLTFENKGVQALMEKAEQQLKRIETAFSFGAWDTACYFFSDDISTTALAANMCKALFTGEDSNAESSHINMWGENMRVESSKEISKILQYISVLRHPLATLPAYNGFKAQAVHPTNMLTGNELPLIISLPRKSVKGVPVIEMAEFGRSVIFEKEPKRTIEFGSIYHMGQIDGRATCNMEDLGTRAPFDLDLLASHCFITGSSGSGKSYATYQLLQQLIDNGIKFLIIEPAKGEYKQVFGGCPQTRIYTTDPTTYYMLRINPFQFPEGLHVLAHIEKLMQIFNASWALYAAMPAILKESVVLAYERCGWDTENSIWISGISDHKYPTFEDVLTELPNIINESDYSANSKGDYKGALLTRVQSMTTGICGMIFEHHEGIQDKSLFDGNAIVDLSDLGSDETIALLMGFMIMKLGEYRQACRKNSTSKGRDEGLKHVTVLEEAHNLLKRTSKEQSQEGSNIVGKSVEMISNSIKEMRTYGEGFIIIDQSPMAVDVSAIENTSTKIIMNTPARDACEELGSALSLNEEQTRELSRLATGVAAVFQKGWLQSVLIKIDEWGNRYEVALQQPDPSRMKKVRSLLVTELYDQVIVRRHTTDLDYSSLIGIIADAGLTAERQSELRKIMQDCYKEITIENCDVEAVIGKYFMIISACKKLFDVVPKTKILRITEKIASVKAASGIPVTIKNELSVEISKWIKGFKGALENYIHMPNDSITNKIIKLMVYYKWTTGKQHVFCYEAIWFVLNEM